MRVSLMEQEGDVDMYILEILFALIGATIGAEVTLR